mmetsp:Transcript_2349/g.5886  ORF Transcript_2349/g.5886 Transcript_2349/m.5886 type:complete len:501 (-) Transcript_2349:97-1599(-)
MPLGEEPLQEALSLQPSGLAVHTALLVAADEEPGGAVLGLGHAAEGAALLLDAPHLWDACGAEEVTHAVLVDFHLRDVGAVASIDVDLALLLLQEPAEVVATALPLPGVAGDESHLADELQDGVARDGELLAGGALLAEGVGEVLGLHGHSIGVESLGVGFLVPQALSVVAVQLPLHRRHDHQLGPAARAQRAEDRQGLGLLLLFLATLVHEKHQGPKLLFHHRQRLPAPARHVAHAVRRDLQRRRVVAVPHLDPRRAFQLLQEHLKVLLGALSLPLSSGHEDNAAHILHDAPGRLRELFPRLALGADGVRELVLVQLHGGCAPIARQVRLAFERGAVLMPSVREVPGHLGLDDAEDGELRAAAAGAVPEDEELHLVLAQLDALALGEAHDRAVLILQRAQEVAALAGDEADCLLRDLLDRAAVGRILIGDYDGTRPLGDDAPHVLHGAPSLLAGACELQLGTLLEEFDVALRHTGDFQLGPAAFAENPGCIVLCDFQYL